jgi:hypothetical protein
MADSIETRTVCPECRGTRLYQGPFNYPYFIVGEESRVTPPCAMCFGNGTIVVRETPTSSADTK